MAIQTEGYSNTVAIDKSYQSYVNGDEGNVKTTTHKCSIKCFKNGCGSTP